MTDLEAHEALDSHDSHDGRDAHDSLDAHDETTETGPGRRSRWDSLRRHPLFVTLPVVVLGLVGLVAALVYSSMQPTLYASDTVIRVYNPYRVGGQQFGPVDATAIASIEEQYAESPGTLRAAEEAMKKEGVSYDHAVWTNEASDATLTVRCLAAGVADAQRCATIFARTYIARRSAAIIKPLRSQIAQLDAAKAKLSTEVQALQKKINKDVGPEGRGTDANRGRLAQQSALLSQMSQISASRQETSGQAQTLAQNYQVVQPSQRPDAPASPLTLRNAAVGLGVGVLLGLALWLALARPRHRRT